MAINPADFIKIKDREIVKTSLFKLLQEYKPNKKTLHIFVENQDDMDFYKNFIKSYYSNFQLYQYLQEGKDGVVGAYKNANWNKFNKNRVLFFRDKDYDDILEKEMIQDHNFFITEYYSIENYLINEVVFDLILRRIYKIQNEVLIRELIDKFNIAYLSFREGLISITSWILIYRRIGEHAVLDGLNLGDFFFSHKLSLLKKRFLKKSMFDELQKERSTPHIVRNSIRFIKSKTILEKSTGADPVHWSYDDMIVNLRVLQKIENTKAYIRGKYDLWFFIHICLVNMRQIVTDLNAEITNHNSNNEHKITRIQCSIEIHEGNIFMIIPPLLEYVPDDIARFLSLNINMLNGDN